jgi:tape measure domain-containing protein
LSGIDKQVTRDLFSGVSQAATVFNLDDQEVGRILTAFGQIASKGKVMSEELKGQVAESLPGALKMAADSMQVSTDQLMEMMKRGELSAKDFLGKFSSYMKHMTAEQFKQVENSYAMQKRRFKRAFEDFKRSLGENGMETFFSAAMKLGVVLLKMLTPILSVLGKSFGMLADIIMGPTTMAVERIMKVFKGMAEGISDGDKGLQKLQEEFVILSGILVPLMVMFRRLFGTMFLFEFIVLLFDDINTYLEGGNSLLGEFLDKLDDPKYREQHPLYDTFANLYEIIGDVVDLIAVTLPNAWKSFTDRFTFGKVTDETKRAGQEKVDAWKTKKLAETDLNSWWERFKAWQTKAILGDNAFSQSLLDQRKYDVLNAKSAVKQMERETALKSYPSTALQNKSTNDLNISLQVQGLTNGDTALGNTLGKGLSENLMLKQTLATAGG